MKLILTLIILLVLLALLWLACLRCRRGHSLWPELRRWRYAHRGLHDGNHAVPENSLAAFRRAAEAGYGAELDIHLTRDGKLAVMHDDNLKRMCGVERLVSESTSAELAQYRLAGTQEKIPYLEEVLSIFAGRAPLIVELKVDGNNCDALCSAAAKLLDKYTGTYCIESFHPLAVRWFRKNRPQVCRGQLSENFFQDRDGVIWLGAFAGTYLLGNFLSCPDFIAYCFADRHNPSLSLCRRLYGVQTVFWTIRSQKDASDCEAEGGIPIFEGFTFS